MKKLLHKLNSRTATKLVTIGLLVFGLGVVISLAIALSVYGKAADCLDTAATCSISSQLVLSKIALAITYCGTAATVVGFSTLIYLEIK